MRRSTLLALPISVVVLGGAAASADACSCVVRTTGSVQADLRDGRPAFIGCLVAVRLIGRPPVPNEGGSVAAGRNARYTYRVERGFNRRFGAYVTVHGFTEEASCGLGGGGGGRRTAMFVSRSGRRWVAGLCDVIGPRELLRAHRGHAKRRQDGGRRAACWEGLGRTLVDPA